MNAIITLSGSQLANILVTIVAALLGGVIYAFFQKKGDGLPMVSLKLGSSAVIATLAIGVVFTPIRMVLDAPLRNWAHPAATLTGCWVQQVRSPERPLSFARLDFDRSGDLFFRGTAYTSALQESAYWKSVAVSIDPQSGTVRYQSLGFLLGTVSSPVQQVNNFGFFEVLIAPDGNHTATGMFVDEMDGQLQVKTYTSRKVECPAEGSELAFLQELKGSEPVIKS